jgi:NAD(P)-dependent dehydrogenase (short-subunit alcohol dehydrogenase family)
LKTKGAQVAQVDVTSPDSIQKFKDSLGDAPIDLLLNIAGVAAALEDDSLQSSNLQVFQRTFAVNTFGVFLLTQALLPNVLAASKPKIGIVSSRVGSVGDNSSGTRTLSPFVTVPLTVVSHRRTLCVSLEQECRQLYREESRSGVKG